MIRNGRSPRQSSKELTAGAKQSSLKETICYQAGGLASKSSNDTSKKKNSLGNLRRTGSVRESGQDKESEKT